MDKKKVRNNFLKLIGIILCIFIFIIEVFGNNILVDGRDLRLSKFLNTSLKKSNIFSDVFGTVKNKVNFVILGVDDDGTRTDVIIVGCFDTKNNKIDLISIPRDTYVEFTKEEEKILKDNERFYPEKGFLKINEVHHYAGEKMGVDFVVKKLQDTLNIQIEYYAKINLEGFRFLVDEIGGVEFNVPQRMIYNDPTQDLYIDLQQGNQILNGKEAEGLIRYRKTDAGLQNISPEYNSGDLQRVQIQQQFLKEFILQVIKKDKIINNIPAILKTTNQYITTNFDFDEIPKYLKYIKDLNKENIVTHTIPNNFKTVNGYQYSFVEINKNEADILINNIFKEENINKNNINSSKEKSIKILNGGSVSGIAKKYEEILLKDGFNILEIGNFEGERQDETYIFVSEKNTGSDLQKYFKSSTIEYNPSYSEHDITIVIGKNES